MQYISRLRNDLLCVERDVKLYSLTIITLIASRTVVDNRVKSEAQAVAGRAEKFHHDHHLENVDANRKSDSVS